jgi:hypothetical protein
MYAHIAAMCGHPDPAEACRLIVNYCKHEMEKIDPGHAPEGGARENNQGK